MGKQGPCFLTIRYAESDCRVGKKDTDLVGRARTQTQRLPLRIEFARSAGQREVRTQ